MTRSFIAFPETVSCKSGDIITVDFGLYYHGVHVDAAVTWPIGAVGPEARRLLDGTYAALLAGTEQVKPGHHVGDISAAIGRTLTARGLTIFRQFVGHGIGRQLHEEPMVPNFPSGRGRKLVPGMALALEPIAGLGSENTILDDNNWDTRTTDGKPAAEFEHTVLVTETGVEVLTPLETLIGSQ
jgi:methionyl aminopeptidase